MVLDLPHGILSLDDFPFSPQTTMDELLTSGLPVRASSCDYFLCNQSRLCGWHRFPP